MHTCTQNKPAPWPDSRRCICLGLLARFKIFVGRDAIPLELDISAGELSPGLPSEDLQTVLLHPYSSLSSSSSDNRRQAFMHWLSSMTDEMTVQSPR
jgi:hypothetical protein